MGMRGAALATIIGQIVSFCISLRYMFHFKTIRLTKESFHMTGRHIENIFKFGASACFNQIAMTIVQIVLNNTLSHYGAQSVYGGDIPLACAGIITKVNMIFMSFVIGISRESSRLSASTMAQRSMNGYGKATCSHLELSRSFRNCIFCFQVFPRQIISVFGSGSELYFQFSERYFRIYMFLTLINGTSRLHRTFSTPSENRSWVYLCPWQDRFSFYYRWSWSFHCLWELTGLCMPDQLQMRQQQSVCGYFMVRELKELSVMDKKKKEESAALSWWERRFF